MARFDVYRVSDEEGYLIDCQAEIHARLSTRFVVPLMPEAYAPRPAERLNPRFVIDGTPYLLVTQFAGAAPSHALRNFAFSLDDHRYEITDAIDFLMTGA